MNELYTKIIAERNRRLESGEDRDPVCVLADQIEAGESVPPQVVSLIWEAHNQGPWRIRTDDEFKIFAEYCELSGTPLEIREPVLLPEGAVNPVRLYEDDFGDCVLAESAKGSEFAVWTRKGRIYIGFLFESMAQDFRAMRYEFGMEATGNRHLKMVVLEAMDTEIWRQRVCCDLIALSRQIQ